MSVLERALALRAKGTTLLISPHDKQGVPRKPSLLFDKRKGESLDLETIFNIGVNGLLELRKHDERFGQFEDTLFSSTAKSLVREMQTKEVNEKLDVSILAFLRLLSPYLLLKPAHKVLEWLIRRFRYVIL